MSLTGLPDGEPGGGPMRVGVAVADLFTGMYTASAILAALYRREQTGEGATIDLALFDTQLAMLANQASNALVGGKDPQRQGAGHPNIVPYQPFRGGRPADHHRCRQRPAVRAAWRRFSGMRNGRRTRPCDQCRARRSARAAGADDRRDHCHQAGGGMAGAAGGSRHSGRADQPHQPGAWPIRRRSIAARGLRLAAARLATCRWSASPFRLDGERSDAPLPPPALGEHRRLLSEWIDAGGAGAAQAAGIVG